MPWPLRMTVIISAAVFPLYIYIAWRFGIALINRFNFRKSIVRITSVSLIIWIYLLPLQYLFLNSKNLFIYNAQIGWMDYLFLYPFWIGLIFVLETLPYFIVIDGFYLISRLKLFTKKDFWKRWLEVSKIVVAAFFLVYVPIRSYLDTNQVRTDDIGINIENLSEEFEGLNFSLIGDVQVDRYTQIDKLQSMQNLINNTQSDLLFFAGDIVTQGKDFIQQALDALCQSQSKVANIACLGDHDYWADAKSISDGLIGCWWQFLDNQHKMVSYKNKQIVITGITHIYSRKISKQNFESLLSNAPDADLKILLVHQPAEFLIEAAAKYGYNLFLAGHTHGGQIVFRPFGIPLTPSQLETKYYTGHHRYKNMHIVVTNGIGLTLAPLRYHSHAEISHLRISSQK